MADSTGTDRVEGQRQAAQVVAAFPATGKTHLARTEPGVIDSDSSKWSWLKQERLDMPRARHPDWPLNYMNFIVSLAFRTSARYVLVSSHAEVRAALVETRVPFTLVIPGAELRDEYRVRMEQRGSSPELIAKVCDELWDDALVDCMDQLGCDLVVLDAGEYLSDVLALDEGDRDGR